MTLNHNYGCFSGVGGIAGNGWHKTSSGFRNTKLSNYDTLKYRHGLTS